jgi:hypothetical protein
MRLLFLVSMASALMAEPNWAARFSVGFKAGSPLNDPGAYRNFRTNYKQSRWTGGPALEFRLFRDLSVEFNAL